MVAVAGVMAGCGSVRVEPGGGGGGQGGASTGFQSKVPPYAAGTRLTPRFLDGGDGAKVLFDFFDHQLGSFCAFVPTSDSSIRCMPETPVGAAVEGIPNQCGVPAAAVALTVNSCNEILATGGLLAPAGTAAPSPLQDLRVHYIDGVTSWPGSTPAPLDSFVGGTIELVPVEGNLSVERLVADDGTRVTIGFARDGHRCEAAHFGSEIRCLDAYLGSTHTWTSAPSVPLFVGTSCMGERAGFFTPSCDKPKPGLASTRDDIMDQCPSEVQYFELLEPVGDCSAQVNQDCIPMLASEYASEGTFARLGAEVPPAALPKLSETDVAGTGRLRVRALVGGGAALGMTQARYASNATTFFDTTLGTTCSARIVAGDEVRCIPGRDPGFPVYQDSKCSVPLMPPDDERCGVVTDNRFVPHGDGVVACGGGGGLHPTEVWERGAPYTGAVYWLDPEAGCVLTTNSGWFQIGTKHPLSDFAVVSLTTP